ncbi:MAG: four helix bundle protein [Verrucomicrobiota bacterium]
MTEKKRPPYDLEERTYQFALRVRLYLKNGEWQPVGWSDVRQLLRSSGSVAANYVESQEAVGDGDFVYRIRVSRKETRESALWLRLLQDTHSLEDSALAEHTALLGEADELVRIFTAIIRKKEPAT